MKKSTIMLVVSSLVFVNILPLVSCAENLTLAQEPETSTVNSGNSDSSNQVEQEERATESSSREVGENGELTESQTSSPETILNEINVDSKQQEQQPIDSSVSGTYNSIDNLSEEATQPSTFAETINIPDPNLRKLINTKLNHSSDWETYEPTQPELASIKGIFRLDLGGGDHIEFTNLEGIQYLTGISSLYSYNVTFSNLGDLKLISNLKQLTYISMGDTNIDNIDFATTLPNLTGMVFPSNRISDIRASLDFYNSPKRKQYNFTRQKLTKDITLEGNQTMLDPIEIIGVNGNQVSITYENSSSYFRFENGKFIGENLQPGQTHIIKYSFADKSINHAGSMTGTATINVKIPIVKGSDVTVKYEDTEGKEISDAKVLNGAIGETYTSEQLAIPGYTFKEAKGDVIGKFTDTPQEVVYVYTKDIVKGSDVTVKYEDTEGKEISDAKVLNGAIGETYTSEQLAIPGYTFKEAKGDVIGKFTDTPQEVVYVYTKDIVKGSDVTVKYEDTEGKEISDAKVLSGAVGETYTSEQLAIPGYTFKEAKGDVIGKFTDTPQEVVYVYTKDIVKGSDVTVKYEDTEGKEISDAKVLSGAIGETYTSEQLTIAGYTFKEIRGDASGKFIVDPQEIVYIYTKSAASGNHSGENNHIKNMQRNNEQQISGNQAKIKKSSKATSNYYQHTYPKTGENQYLGKRLTLLGIILIGLLAGLSIWNKRRSFK